MVVNQLTLAVILSQESVDKLASAGATAAAEPAEVAAECDRVVTMLPNSPHVESVYSSLLTTASPGTLFLDCSTIDPAVAKKVTSIVKMRGISFSH